MPAFSGADIHSAHRNSPQTQIHTTTMDDDTHGDDIDNHDECDERNAGPMSLVEEEARLLANPPLNGGKGKTRLLSAQAAQVCACVYVCLWCVCVCVCLCITARLLSAQAAQVCAYVICVSVFGVCVCIYIYIYIYIYSCMHVHIHTYIYMYSCMNVYIHINIHTYIHSSSWTTLDFGGELPVWRHQALKWTL